MRFWSVSALFLALGAVQAFGGVGEGKAVYEAKCQKCHKADGAGMAAMKMRPLGSAEVQAKSDGDLKKDSMGVGKMPKQTLTDAEAADVVAYIRTLKK